MKTELINRYSGNNFVNKDAGVQKNSQNGAAQKTAQTKKTDPGQDVNSLKSTGKNYNNVITKQERKFFVKMFPESEEQINNHVLFNRNGKVQSTNVYKGSLVDGKV